MKKNLLAITILFSCIFFSKLTNGQGIPELMYYKFNTKGDIPNLANGQSGIPPMARIYGGLLQGDTGTCGTTALMGDSLSSRNNYVDTKWTTNITGSWTISFWTKRTGGTYSAQPYYLFGDSSAGAFRCFTKGYAGTDNWIIRGPFTEVLASGGATNSANITTFVYNSTAGYIYAYINGKLVNSVAQASAITLKGTQVFKIGAYGTIQTNIGIQKNGLLDEFRFYTRALTATEVARLKYGGQTSATVNIQGCNPFTSPSGRYVWTSDGKYSDTINNGTGCDSFMTINLTLLSHSSSVISPTACDFYVSPSKNSVWTKTGTYTDKIKNKAGCDSNMTINLTIKNSTLRTFNIKDCNSYKSPSGKYTWTVSGKYEDTIPNKKGCDSFMTINLTLGKTSTNTLSIKTCDSYKSPSGKYIWTISGQYKDTIMNKSGCDSLVTINLTLGKSTTGSIAPTVCNKYKSPSGKTGWIISGTYMDTIANHSGCDSVITVQLTLNKSTFIQITPVTCSKYTSPSGKYTYTVSNSFFDTIPNKAGCDSIILIDLKVIPKTSGTISRTACKRYFSPSGKYIWTISGKYMDTILNKKGCDSIVTINLTVNAANVTVTQNKTKLSAMYSGGTYQWLDCNSNYSKISGATSQSYTVTAIGKYAVEVSDGFCTDTSICYNIPSLHINKSKLNNYLSVYPNPSPGQFTISSVKPLNNATIKIVNTLGETIVQKNDINGNTLNLDISSQANGIYFIEISEKENSGRIKLIKY